MKNIQLGIVNYLERTYVKPTRGALPISAVPSTRGFVSQESKPRGTVAGEFGPRAAGGLTDEKLYELCKKFGAAALHWRQKFIRLLPEVNRRRLYEKKGFSSIFEFSFKLCGLSAEQVRLTLNLRKRFEDKPILRKMLENGEASINKLARVVSVATSGNEAELAKKIKVLSVRALETLVRDEKMTTKVLFAEGNHNVFQNQNGLDKPRFDAKGLHVQMRNAIKKGKTQDLDFELDDNIKQELNELNSKGIDVNELIRKMLAGRKEQIAQEKIAIVKCAKAKEGIADSARIAKTIQPKKSRYISAAIRNLLKQEHGNKCSISTCSKPAAIIHHTQRFGLSQNHDPHFLAPLCKEHHAIAHCMDIKYQMKRAAPATHP